MNRRDAQQPTTVPASLWNVPGDGDEEAEQRDAAADAVAADDVAADGVKREGDDL